MNYNACNRITDKQIDMDNANWKLPAYFEFKLIMYKSLYYIVGTNFGLKFGYSIILSDIAGYGKLNVSLLWN